MKEYPNWEEWMKDKLEKEEVVFQEAHWEAAQKLLDKGSPDTRMPLWKSRGMKLFPLLLLILVSFYVLEKGYFSKKEKSVEQNTAFETEIRDNTPDRKPINTETDMKANHNILKQETHSGIAKNEGSIQNSVNPENIQKTSANTNPADLQPSKREKGSNSGNELVKKSAPTIQEYQKQQRKANSGITKDAHSSAEGNSISGMNTALKNVSYPEGKMPLFGNQEKGENSGLNENKPEKELFVMPVQYKSAGESLSSAERGIENPVLLQEKDQEEPIIVKPLFDNILRMQSESTKILSENAFLATDLGTPEKSKSKKGDYYIFAGTSTSPQSLVFSPTFGVGYRRMTGKGFGLTAFMNYAIIRNFPNITKQVNQTQYGLGFENTAYILTTKSLHFAEAGIGFSIPFQRNEIFGGINGSRLIYSAAKLEVVKSNTFGQKGISSENVSGYTQGLEKWDAGLSAGYGFSVLRNMQFRVSGHYGFTDLTKNDFFGNSNIHKNSQMRVGVLFRF